MMDADVGIVSDSINVCLVNFLPRGIHEQVIRNHDDSYTILIDAKQSWENQCKSYKHAVRHITNKDFDSMRDVQDIEMVAHSCSSSFSASASILIPSDKFEKIIQRKLRIIRRRRKKTLKRLNDYNKKRSDYFELLNDGGRNIDTVLDMELERIRLGSDY